MFSSTTVKYFSKQRKPGKTKAFFICLCIAAFLWLAHSLNTVYTYTLRLPVTFVNLPMHKKPLMPLPEAVHVQIKASGLKLTFMLLNRPFKPLEIDFNKLKTANRNQNYILSSESVNFRKVLKFESQVKQVTPDTLYFSEKTGYQKVVPVKVPLYIKSREGYGYRKPVVNPNYITIWGDTSLITGIDTIYTQPLTLNDLSQNVSSNISFIRPDPEIYTSASSAHVFIEVARLVEHTLYIPVTDANYNPRHVVNIYPARVKVRFTALQNSFNEADSTLFKAMIDTRKVNKKTRKCPVFMSMVPGNVTIMEISPKEVEILIFRQ